MTTEKALAIRTCAKDGTAYGGFKWPLEVGATVTAPDWNSSPKCGNGLHALLDGNGDYSLLSSDVDAVWQVVEVDSDKVVAIDSQKVKFETCKIVYSGGMAGAMTMISNNWIKLALAEKDGENFQSASGDYSQLAASGDYSQLAASGDSSRLAASGFYSQLAASGDSSQLAASGDYSRLAASGFYSRLAASGFYSQLAASGDSSQLAASGDKSIAVGVGLHSTVSAGKDGCIALSYWDDVAERFKLVVGYVGEKGIKENVSYKLNDKHEFVAA